MENGEFINKLRQQHHQQQQPAAVSQQHQQEAADLDPNFDRKLDLILQMRGHLSNSIYLQGLQGKIAR
jgi:type II secretory pathway component PulL